MESFVHPSSVAVGPVPCSLSVDSLVYLARQC